MSELREYEYETEYGVKHQYGETYTTRFSGTAARECLVDGCDYVCVFWDEDDLEEDGNLYHYVNDN